MPSKRHRGKPRPKPQYDGPATKREFDAQQRAKARPDGQARPRTQPRTPSLVVTPDELLARVLYRDALIIVLDKPAGIPVHAGPGGGPNLEDLFDVLRFGLPRPPSLGHRLDRDTSGCLVLGRHPKALRKLGAIFAGGRARKTYWAVVDGVPKKPEGVLDFALRKITPTKGWKMEVTSAAHPQAQAAETSYKVMGTAETPHGPRAWLACEPKTGRTHQIRVHLAEIGCPVVGDPIYGRAAPLTDDAPRAPLHLHARAISLPLSPSRPPIVVTAPVPAHMREALTACGYTET
jgi:tRNA pseudouridine32 synthase/23S rRNA pseudouridine746 synthase/23S rRNA pseudouridine1911/1915/1917 synthase